MDSMDNKDVKARNEVLRDVKLYLANDWEIKEETPEYFLLSRNEQRLSVHLLLAIFFWWLFFIPNLIYYFSSKKTKKIIK